MTERSVEELDSSDLGTYDYWEKAYSVEIDNFRNYGDIGEVWFGEDSTLRIIRWMSLNPELIKDDDKIIDLGCGNGMMLAELADEGFKNLTGVDYSQKAIDLANEVLKARELSNVNLIVYDISSNDIFGLPSDFKVVHDKGTYDAICLNPEDPKQKRERYIENVYKLLLPEGLLILTSCNWTQDELKDHFKIRFEILNVIPTPSFKFGGRIGHLVTSLVFKKR